MKADEDPNYATGWRAGYSAGEYERVALATANSDLRSQVRELLAELEALR